MIPTSENLLSETTFATEFPSLKDTVYLDNAASPPAPYSAVLALADSLKMTLYSNPHSLSPSSIITSQQVDKARDRVLSELFGIKERKKWDIIFTSGATASMKLVAECVPWGRQYGDFKYVKESHTSLVGMRAFPLAAGCRVHSLNEPCVSEEPSDKRTVWAYPAQCNVTGSRLGLSFCRNIKRQQPRDVVLVDAAAYMTSSVMKLDEVPYDEAPDFIAFSFYKIFGYPTGLGALIVKASSSSIIEKPTYLGGGAISAISTSAPYWSHAATSSLHAVHENGTIPFLSIIALSHSMDIHKRLFGECQFISNFVIALSHATRTELSELRHFNGKPLVKIHASHHSDDELLGPTLAFSVFDPNGDLIGHQQLGNLATLAGFQVRTGGLCNTGVLTRVSGLSDTEMLDLYERGRVCGDETEFAPYMDDRGKPKLLGLCRISFGPTTRTADVQKFIQFLKDYFLVTSSSKSLASAAYEDTDSAVFLQSLVRYPIKSCAGQSLESSRLTAHGLLYDREFAVIEVGTGRAMSQKQFPRMALIKPFIDDSNPTQMIVQAVGMTQDLIVPLLDLDEDNEDSIRICSDTVSSRPTTQEATEWLSQFLSVDCQLHRYSASSSRHSHFQNSNPTPILLSNESPFSLISQSSVDKVNSWITSGLASDESDPIHYSCFRANMLLSSQSHLLPFEEDSASLIKIGHATFQVLARCRRCLMICVDQETGVRQKEPYCALAKHRKNSKSRIEFGVHLLWRDDLSSEKEPIIRVGDPVTWKETTCLPF